MSDSEWRRQIRGRHGVPANRGGGVRISRGGLGCMGVADPSTLRKHCPTVVIVRFENVHVPYGAYWSTPFVKWQGKLASLHPIRLAAEVARQALEARRLEPGRFDSLVLGLTIPSKQSFWGAPWLASMIGAPGLTGPTVSQACATSAKVIATAAADVELSGSSVLGVACDRTSNGPHLYYPDGAGPGGRGEAEDWVWDNFNRDPNANVSMVQTAENVAREAGIGREEQDELTLVRYQQYAMGEDGGARFRARYLAAPLPVKDGSGRVVATVEDDEGIFPTTAEGLSRLRPTMEGGTVTFGTQTHPADGNAGMILASPDASREMSRDDRINVRLLSYGQARARKGYMPEAPAPAARAALEAAGISISDVAVIKTHNPFAVNDLYLARELDLDATRFNNHGCSLVYGHPQGPTGMRLVIELIEELVDVGGGYGLFTGCAAGDTGAALVLRVG
jgi:acetyl-CoA acetyltransferase family protein